MHLYLRNRRFIINPPPVCVCVCLRRMCVCGGVDLGWYPESPIHPLSLNLTVLALELSWCAATPGF